MITTLIFDLGGVLINVHQSRFRQKLLRIFPESDPEHLHEAFFNSPDKDLFESGHLSSHQFLERVGGTLGLHIDPVLFVDFWTDIFSENEEICSLIPSLRERYSLALLSNTNKPHMDYIDSAFPVISLFDHRFLSYTMQLLKPDAAIFREVLNTLHISPDEALYIDDSEANTAAAAALGIQVIHFRNNADFFKTVNMMHIL